MIFMYGIHRTEKRNRSAVYGLQIEANRTQADHLKGRNFHGSDIDWTKTDENVFLVKCENWNKAITDILNENNIKERKTSIVLLDTIYTASSNFFEDKSKDEIIDYFKACLEFHKKTYGDHVISAVIHFDEVSHSNNIHMHVQVVPLIKRADNTYSLSARDIMGNRTDYRKKQDDFYSQVSSLWGLERGEVKDYGEIRKHLNKMEFEVQQMQVKAQKAKAELDIRQRVLDACANQMVEIEVLASTSENKLLKKPATSTVRTDDLKRLQSQIKTSKDLQNGLREMDKLAKETMELASTDEKVLEVKEELYKSQSRCHQLEQNLKESQIEVSRLTEYIQKLEQWFNTVKTWIQKRKLVRDFEQFVEHETKELVREEIEYEHEI